jgi:hypothetical protein
LIFIRARHWQNGAESKEIKKKKTWHKISNALRRRLILFKKLGHISLWCLWAQHWTTKRTAGCCPFWYFSPFSPGRFFIFYRKCFWYRKKQEF